MLDEVNLLVLINNYKNLINSQMVNTTAKLLAKSTSQRVQKGMDITVGKVTLPHMKHLSKFPLDCFFNYEI